MSRLKKTPTSMLGIFTDHGKLGVVYMANKEIKDVFWEDIPEDAMDGGSISSKSLFAAFLKDQLRRRKIRCKNVSVVIGSGRVFIRNVSLPVMSEEQLRLNLPYEFRDYIQGELKDYLFDYAYRPPLMEPAEPPTQIDLLAVAMPAQHLKNIEDTMRVCGLRIVRAVPEVCCYERLLRQMPDETERMKEWAFIDIGYDITKMFVYKNGRYKLSHMIDSGVRDVIQAVADDMNVDMRLARTYVETDYSNCTAGAAAQNSYRDISLGVLKGLNFYEMADMTARLRDVVITGSGSQIAPLTDLLKSRISMSVKTVGEVFPQYGADTLFNVTAPATGILLD